MEFCAYDVDKANEYLDKVAPAGANGDRGISVTLSYNQDGGHKEIMESIIGDLAKVGVNAVSDTPEWSALLEQYQNFNYQFGRLAGSPITRLWTTSCIRCSTPTPSVATTVPVTTTPSSMPRSTRLALLLTTKSASLRCRRPTPLSLPTAPVIPLMFYTHTLAGSDRIKHLYVDPQKHADLGTAELA